MIFENEPSKRCLIIIGKLIDQVEMCFQYEAEPNESLALIDAISPN